MCLNISYDMLKIRYAKIRLGPIWAKAHMGQGPYGPGPIWAPGPWAPGPSLLGKHLTKKRTLEKTYSKLCFFNVFLETKKTRGVRTIILAAVSRRDLCYVSENEGFRFVNSATLRGACALSNWFMYHN